MSGAPAGRRQARTGHGFRLRDRAGAPLRRLWCAVFGAKAFSSRRRGGLASGVVVFGWWDVWLGSGYGFYSSVGVECVGRGGVGVPQVGLVGGDRRAEHGLVVDRSGQGPDERRKARDEEDRAPHGRGGPDPPGAGRLGGGQAGLFGGGHIRRDRSRRAREKQGGPCPGGPLRRRRPCGLYL